MSMLRAGLLLGVFLIPLSALSAADPTDAQGDSLPSGATARLGTLRWWQPNWVVTLVFAPDGKTVASGDGDGVIRLWEVATGKQTATLKGFAPLWLATGKQLLVVTSPTELACLTVATGRSEWQLPMESVKCMAASPDGKWLALGQADGKVHLYDLATRKCVHSWHDERTEPGTLRFSPDSQKLAVGYRAHVFHVWDMANYKRLRRWHKDTWREPSTPQLAFTDDGKTLITGLHASGSSAIRLLEWDLSRREPRSDRISASNELLIDPRGKWFLSDDGARLLIRSTSFVGDPIAIQPESLPLNAWAASPDGETFAGVNRAGRIMLWSSRTGKLLNPPPGHVHPLHALALSADGQTVVTSDDYSENVHVWNGATGNRRRTYVQSARPNSLLLSADGRRLCLVSVDEKLTALELENGKQLAAPVKQVYGGSSVQFLPGTAAVLYTAQIDQVVPKEGGLGELPRLRQLYTWDLQAPEGKPLPIDEMEVNEPPRGTFLSPDGRCLASWKSDGPVVVWDARSGRRKFTFTPKNQAIAQAVFSPDSRLLAVVTGERVHLLEIGSGQERQLLGVEQAAQCAVWLPGGRGLVIGHANGALSVRDVLSGRCAELRAAHAGAVKVLALSADGKVLASGSADGTALLWPTPCPPFTPDRSGGLSVRQLDSAWENLASSNGLRVTQAILALSEDPVRAVPFLQRQLQAVKALSMSDVKRLLAQLDDDEFETRQQATAQLASVGKAIEPALFEMRRGDPSVEVRARLERVLQRLDQQPLDAETLRHARVIEVLERAATPEARRLLQTLAQQPAWTPLAREATSALKRLEGR